MEREMAGTNRGATRGRPRGSRSGRNRGRRGRKQRVVVSDEEETNEIEQNQTSPAICNDPANNNNTTNETDVNSTPEVVSQDKPMEVSEIDDLKDVEQLELEATPSFGSTTMQRNVPQVMLRLNWDHKVNLIAEKVLNPMIYCCDMCEKPILIYGRIIPCKHVFCLACTRTEAVLKQCPRCKDKVSRVEQTGVATVFMCSHGGTRYGSAGCRRTYLSQRDLQAHINHRHVTAPVAAQQDTKSMTDKQSTSSASTLIVEQINSHIRKELMAQPPSMGQPHPLNKPFNSSNVFQSAQSRTSDNQQSHGSGQQPQMMGGMMNSHTAANNKMPHHSQDMHHNFYNQHTNFGGNNFGAGSSSSSSGVVQVPNNFYQPPYSQSFNSMGHYSQQPPPSSQQQQQNWNQQQYFR